MLRSNSLHSWDSLRVVGSTMELLVIMDGRIGFFFQKNIRFMDFSKFGKSTLE